MNTCCYTVRPEVIKMTDDGVNEILSIHSCEPDTKDGDGVKSCTEQKIAEANQSGNAPEELFKREEIDEHDDEKAAGWSLMGRYTNSLFHADCPAETLK